MTDALYRLLPPPVENGDMMTTPGTGSARRGGTATGRAALLAFTAMLCACSGGGNGASSDPPPPAALTISTTTLPAGQVGLNYTAGLSATGGVAPLSWSLTGGTLPAGLSHAGTGVISGVPQGPAGTTSLTFTVTDSSAAPAHQQVTLPLTIAPAITVAVSPARAALTVTQTLKVSAVTNDASGVTWSASPAGGSFSSTSSASGVAVTYTAPVTAGVVTITAASVSSPTQQGSLTVGVTDLPGVYTWHNDLARDGVNTREFALTPANVNTTTFGKLFTCTVDGAVYAQPLWVAKLAIGGGAHNVIFVATAHDSLYAFDADATPCRQYWKVSLIDTAHHALGGEVPVPSGPQGFAVGQGEGDITPEVGVIGTPVIDPVRQALYVVSKSMNAPGTVFHQRLHAIDLATGAEKAAAPVDIVGSSLDSGGTTIAFSPQQENQRVALALVNGTVYIAWGSHEDKEPWYGWIIAYTYNPVSGFTQSAVLNVAPDATQVPAESWGGAGIWMSGGGPAADANGNLYILTGNGPFGAISTGAPAINFGDCFLQLSPALAISSSFTPSDWKADRDNDDDFGSGGAALVINVAAGPVKHLVVGGGKDGTLYLLDGDALGGVGDSHALQHFSMPGARALFATSAFWNNTLYIAPVGGGLLAYAFNTATERFATTPASQSQGSYGFPGATPAVSASGSDSDGIVWTLDSSRYCTPHSAGCGPAVLHAHDATHLATELWNSTGTGNTAGNAVKFTVPTVANGRVYVGTRGNNTGGTLGSTSAPGELDVYGLKPN